MTTEMKTILTELQQLRSQFTTLQESARMELLTIDEVAGVLKFTRKHIYSMIKAGTFPKQMKIGSASRWKKTDLEDWINQQMQGAA